MAENLRMGNEEEEMLHCEGDSDYNNRFRGRGGVGEMDMEGPSIEFGDRAPSGYNVGIANILREVSK